MRKKTYISIFAGSILVAIILLSIYLFNFAQQPLNQQLTIEPRLSTFVTASQIETDQPILPPTSTITASTSHSTEEGICGQTGAYIVLIIGSDVVDKRGQPGADLTRLARVDFTNKKVNIFALSRDLWVNVRSLGFRNPVVTDTTLGRTIYEAYQRSKQDGMSGRMTDGTQASAQVIFDNFGVMTDHYLVIDLHMIPKIIDTVGGVSINVPERTTDPWIGTVIEAGPQVLSGDRLMAYARANPGSDLERIQRNDLILYALRQKLLDPFVWIKLPEIYDQSRNMIVTDLSPQKVMSLFCLLKEAPKENIVMAQIQPEWTSSGPSGSILWDQEKLSSKLKQLSLLP